jgi:hypothetical protein
MEGALNAAVISAMAAASAVLVSTFTLLFSVIQSNRTARAKIREDLLQRRRDALFAALQVIDHVYSNEPILNNGECPNPHEWPIQSARDADNSMRIYCGDPQTLVLFKSAVGLHNPLDQPPPGIDAGALEAFRRQIAKELDIAMPVNVSDPGRIWIASLSGAK